MYLEMLKHQDVVLNLNQDEKLMSEKKDVLITRLFKLTELAKLLGAKSVNLLQVKPCGMIDLCKDSIFIDYIDSSYDDNALSEVLCKNSKLVIRVYWDDCNQALTLEEIWYEGEKVGYMKYSKKKNSAKPNKVLRQEEVSFFDIKYTNYDFTLSGKEFMYHDDGKGNIRRVDK